MRYKSGAEKREQMTIWIWRILAGSIWGAIIVLLFLHRKDFTVDEILKFTPANSLLAALTMLMLFALKSVSIVFYSGILYAVNGILFPLPAAILLNLLGTVVMVTIPYLIGKKGGSRSVKRIVERYPKADRLREFHQKNDFIFVLIMRIAGILPCDIVSLYMGAIQINYSKYMLGCLLGLLPSTITFPVMGMSITDIHSPLFITALCIELLFMFSSVLIYRIYKKKQEPKMNTKEG